MTGILYPYYYTSSDDDHQTIRCATYKSIDFKIKREVRGLAMRIAQHLHSLLSKELDFDIDDFPNEFRVYEKVGGEVIAEFEVEARVTTSFEIIT